MTLDELEKWLTDFIVNVYHGREHSALKMSPLARWERGIVGDGKRKGIGLPDPVADPERLRLDFLPFNREVRPAGGHLLGQRLLSRGLPATLDQRPQGEGGGEVPGSPGPQGISAESGSSIRTSETTSSFPTGTSGAPASASGS